MIKAEGKRLDGKRVFFFGLSHENLRRLKLGQPIKINGDEIGFPLTVFVIFVGETEKTMANDLINSGLLKKNSQEKNYG